MTKFAGVFTQNHFVLFEAKSSASAETKFKREKSPTRQPDNTAHLQERASEVIPIFKIQDGFR